MHYNETIVNLMDKDEVSCFKLWSNCDRTKNHSNSVNTMGFRVSFFCLIVVNSCQLFACLCWKLFHSCYKECVGRQPCLFVCYGKHELHQTMDGGGSDYIE